MRRRSMFAVAAPGLEDLVAAELRDLGLPGQVEPGGVAFQGTLRDAWRANLWLRVASRVLVRLEAFPAPTFAELERRLGLLGWDRYLAPGTTVDVRVASHGSRLYHQRAVAQRVRSTMDAHVPGLLWVEERDPEAEGVQSVLLRLQDDLCTVSLDTSGPLLHRRGWRQSVTPAPLRETLAAAMVRASAVDGPLLDPLCGSGTLPIEAALRARRVAPGRDRSFAFEKWPVHDARAFADLRLQARSQEVPWSGAPFEGRDQDPAAVEAARQNARRAGVEDSVRLEVAALEDLAPGPLPLVTNPPYGHRLSLPRGLLSCLRRAARTRVVGVLVPTAVDLGWPPVFRTTNGGIPVGFCRHPPA